MKNDNFEYLNPTPIIDSDHPSIQQYAREIRGGSREPVDIAVKLYNAARDGILYDPYSPFISRNIIVQAMCSNGAEVSACQRLPFSVL